VGRAGSLSGNHTAGDAGFDSVAKRTGVFGSVDVHAPYLVAAMRPRVTAYANHVRLLARSIETRKLSRAARQMDLSSSATSHALAKLVDADTAESRRG
jgi:hypothetical protein